MAMIVEQEDTLLETTRAQIKEIQESLLPVKEEFKILDNAVKEKMIALEEKIHTKETKF